MSTVDTDISLRVLGPLEVAVDGRRIEQIPRKERQLLAMLVLESGRAVMLGEIVATIWPDVELSSERKSTQVLVYRLRRRLEEAGAPEGTLITGDDGEGYALSVPAGSSDLATFERLVAEASDEPEPAAMARLLDRALGLWRGEPLPDLIDTDRGTAERARLLERRREAEEDRADALLAVGHHQKIVGELEAALGAEPLRERRWGQLMTALYRSGRQADALRAYQRARDLLIEELGIEPGHELRRIEQAIVDQDDEAVASSSRFQTPASVVAGRGPDAARGRREVGSPIGWVRSDHSFVAPADLLDTLDAAVHAARERFTVLTVAGVGGVGKSSVLRAAAGRFGSAGATVLAGRCDRVRGRRFAALQGALDQWVDDHKSIEEDTPSDVAESLIGIVGAHAADPAVLMLDDLGEADGATIEVLQRLATAVAGLPFLLVLAYRDDKLRSQPEALDLLADLHHQAGTNHEIRLTGLGATGATLLLADLLDLPEDLDDHLGVATLVQETAGHPRHLVELAHHLRRSGLPEDHGDWTISHAELPSGIRHDIGHRVRELRPDDLPILQIAAVAGLSFDPADIAVAARIELEAVLDCLDRAQAAGLVRDDEDDRYSFSSLVVRQVIYGDIQAGRRTQMHRRLGEALAGGDLENPGHGPAAVADHLARASEAEGRSADRPSRPNVDDLEYLAAHREAIRLRDDEADDAGHVESWGLVLLGIASSRRHGGELSAARKLYRQAADEARRVDQWDLLARAAIGVGGVSRELGVLAAIDRELLEEACRSVPDDDSLHRGLREELLLHLLFEGRWREAATVSETSTPDRQSVE